MRPFERCSTPALKAFIHSCGASLTVGDDNFMVNCWACATPATRMTAALATKRETQDRISGTPVELNHHCAFLCGDIEGPADRGGGRLWLKHRCKIVIPP